MQLDAPGLTFGFSILVQSNVNVSTITSSRCDVAWSSTTNFTIKAVSFLNDITENPLAGDMRIALPTTPGITFDTADASVRTAFGKAKKPAATTR